MPQISRLHFGYWILILIFVVIALLSVEVGDDKDLANIVAFGLTFSSFALSIVAIIQTLLSSFSALTNSAILSEKLQKLESSTQNLQSVSEKMEEIAEEVKETKGHVSKIAGRFDATKTVSGHDHGTKSWGTVAVMHAIFLAHKHNRALDLNAAIPIDDARLFYNGYLESLRNYPVRGIELTGAKEKIYIVKSLGDIKEEEATSAYEARTQLPEDSPVRIAIESVASYYEPSAD